MITCTECKSEGMAAPMLHDEVWAKLAGKNENLCGVCLFNRLSARDLMLSLADLRPCPFNLFHRPYSYFDLFKGDATESEVMAWLVELGENKLKGARPTWSSS